MRSIIRPLTVNLALALAYVLVRRDPTFATFMVGFVIGYALMVLVSMETGQRIYGYKLFKLIRFALYFLFILVKANLQITREIITPGMNPKPRILRYPVEDLSDIEITTLANCITLTPGTLVVDVSEDGNCLYVHCMYAEDRAAAIADLDKLAQRLKQEVFS